MEQSYVKIWNQVKALFILSSFCGPTVFWIFNIMNNFILRSTRIFEILYYFFKVLTYFGCHGFINLNLMLDYLFIHFV